ncbi:MAG: YraN family protein [Rhodospirillales bacterium]|nr:YraN family protein [Rhodospirillales bacterium]
MAAGATHKRRARRYGRYAETLSAWLLRAKGYRILERGFRVPQGEIDIIARRGRIVAIVEVKARATREQAAYALKPRQQRRIRRAAEAFLAARPGLCGLDIRFDVILISPWRPPRHLCDAWRV